MGRSTSYFISLQPESPIDKVSEESEDDSISGNVRMKFMVIAVAGAMALRSIAR